MRSQSAEQKAEITKNLITTDKEFELLGIKEGDVNKPPQNVPITKESTKSNKQIDPTKTHAQLKNIKGIKLTENVALPQIRGKGKKTISSMIRRIFYLIIIL